MIKAVRYVINVFVSLSVNGVFYSLCVCERCLCVQRCSATYLSTGAAMKGLHCGWFVTAVPTVAGSHTLVNYN